MSIITRTSTFAANANFTNNFMRVQTRLFDAQNQISSGLKTQNFAGLAGQVEQFVSLEAKIRTSINYQENNAQNISRLETTKKALEQITNKADEMQNLIVLRRNPALANDIAFEQQMRAMMQSVASELNITFEAKYLFAGTRTNVPPVADPITPPFKVGEPDDSYYRGSKEDLTLRADERVEFAYRVRADNDAFQAIFAAAHQAIAAHNANDDSMLARALDTLQGGIDKVIATTATVNADILAIENIRQRQNSLELYWKGVTEQLANTDILAVSTKLAADQTILQASFQSFATINQLRLTNFL
jgi:flagellar hook-associated protein 3 FlgL